ncbi:hypothetical protein FRC09_001072 [Ceratobasidium sp. 395]|nr:hypothetical protein FRC09_001072 [Ceratobasidium sp. 395]
MSLGIRPDPSKNGPVPRKAPVQNLSDFFISEHEPDIHVYFDRRPFISLEDPNGLASWGFSLVKWEKSGSPEGIFRGKLAIPHHRCPMMSLIVSALMIDREGVLYNGADLRRWIPRDPPHEHNPPDDDSLKGLMRSWLALRSLEEDTPPKRFHQVWNENTSEGVTPDTRFDKWLQMMLSKVVSQALDLDFVGQPVLMPEPTPGIPPISSMPPIHPIPPTAPLHPISPIPLTPPTAEAHASKPFTIIVLAPPTGRFGSLRSPAKGTMVCMWGVLAGVNDSEVTEINLEPVMFISNANRPGSGLSLSSSTLSTVGQTKRPRRQDGNLASLKMRMGSSSVLLNGTGSTELPGDVGQPSEASAEASTSGSSVD